MSLYKDPNSPHWYLSLCINGKRIRRSTGTASKKEAQRIHDELAAGERARKRSGITWHAACIDWLNVRQRSASERYTLQKLALPDCPLSELTADIIEAHLPEVPGTYIRQAGLVTAILNLARRKGHLDTVPILTRKQVIEARIRWLTQEEWQRLYKQLPPHLKPLARFSVTTGLRQHNATHLEWSQVDMRRKVAWIHADQAKAGKPLGIPLSDEAMDVLRGQRGQSEVWVFPYKGRPLAKIKTAWGKALRRAGIIDFRWHDLRHTWATWHVQAGTPLEVLQKLGGWASYSMVLKYAHFAPEYLAGYANNAKPYSKGEAECA